MPRKKLTQAEIDRLAANTAQIEKAARDNEAAAVNARYQNLKIRQTLRNAAMQIPQQRPRD